jgi:hypothetical protein
MSAVFQNLPGVQIQALRQYSNADVASSLGHNLSSCPTATGACSATVGVQLIEPNTVFEDRLTQLDLRFAKNVRIGRGRVQLSVDAFNVLNGSAILGRINNYGSTWGLPTSIVTARFFKFGAQVDF